MGDARGMSRDISEGGLGFVTQQHVPRGTNLHIKLELPDSRYMELCGEAIQSLPVRLGWYSVGMKFGPVSDPRLLPTVEPGKIHAIMDAENLSSLHSDITVDQ
ncbi:MAG: PilZ domain-containing protein [Planctomycetota bacterium]